MLKPSSQLRLRKEFALRLAAFAVFGNGLVITLNSLASHVVLRRRIWDSRIQINLGIIIGLTLIYLSSLLLRYKYNAWLLTILIYAFILGANTMTLLLDLPVGMVGLITALRALVLPAGVVGVLVLFRREFTVRSDIQSFTLSLRRIALVLSVALLYGVIGFKLLDNRDFHQNISWWSAVAYSIDQFGVFTNGPVQAFTERGKVFLDSLSLISSLSLAYGFIALFQPLRARLSDQSRNRLQAQMLLERYHGSSEDYFKLWPKDKTYIFSDDQQAVIAYHVTRGVALGVGDPVGKPDSLAAVLTKFQQECRTNDWLPAFVHLEAKYTALYVKHDFSIQKIGEEAVVSIAQFLEHQAKDKYFRQINNKFNKQGFTTELLHPPHNPAVLQRLRRVSDEWLQRPGRAERGLMMGYFSDEYIQSVPVLVLRDAADTIQAFVTQVHSYDASEANYDMLRFSDLAPGNSNDFLLLQFIQHLHSKGFERLNLGLCPLAGVGDEEDEPGLIDNVLRFVYTNGDRIYSFSGLHRFKSKYNPEWRDRYIAYQGGLRGLSRTTTALTKAMKR